MHLLYYLGLFRLLPVQEFRYEVGFGYLAEMFISIMPMFMLQVMNNMDTIEGQLT
jgi:hypothetical protein